MAIGLKKLVAGRGYEYLTRQVAALDADGLAHGSLAAYYSATGETPGCWRGSGLAALGLQPGERVTEQQMELLFGTGLHPVTGEALGQRYSVFANEPTAFDEELTRRLDAWRASNRPVATGPVPKRVRDELRTALGREWFTAQFGRPPTGPRELHGFITKAISHPRVAVAGYDLSFSPAKSISTLWALADPPLAEAIRTAHEAAVADAAAFLEERVAHTRLGHNGVRQVDVRGLVMAVFVHRDSRSGDPDLHTHVAVANKVQTLDGRWRALDGRILHAAKVATSEVYTTSLQARLTELGLRFTPSSRDGKRPVWEIDGIPEVLCRTWSQRRTQVTAALTGLVARFEADHERPPTPSEKLDLAQQATLASRPSKHAPRSEAEQRATWRAQADQLLGRHGVDRVPAGVRHAPTRAPAITPAWLTRTAAQVVAAIEAQQATWQEWHIRAEALRQVRSAGIPLAQVQAVTDQLVGLALSPAHSVRIATIRDLPEEPSPLRRRTGASVYEVAGATRFTSSRILRAEQRLIEAAGRTDGRAADPNSVTLALLESLANRAPLNPGQQLLVHDMATSARRLQLAIAPAGTGKTTATRALAVAWTSSGGTVLGLAPSATAAEQLADHLPVTPNVIGADTLAKLAWAIDHAEPLANRIDRRTLLIIDEAGMADTPTLDTVVHHALGRGASVRLIGDDQQLGAIGAGGVLRDIASRHGALQLDEVLRFAHPAEAAASLGLRVGDPAALGFYYDHHRVHVIDADTASDHVLHAWRTDRAAGRDALMLAPTRALVADLNHAARLERLAGHRPRREALLSDGNHASPGDIVLTRRNDRTLIDARLRWVRNGDRWAVTAVRRGGAIHVRNLRTGGHLTLPAEYIATSVELGYATTIHGAQGATADTCHGILTGDETRQQLYTMLSRGRDANHAWIQVTTPEPAHTPPTDKDLHVGRTANQILESVLARDDTPVSATTQLARADDPVRLLSHAVACYLDAIGFAAEHHLTAQAQTAIDAAGAHFGLTDAEAWPTLRAHLALYAANGHHPDRILTEAVARGSLATAHDPAAVVDWRLDLTDASSRSHGPLPWLPGIPSQLLDSPQWKPYLSERFKLAHQLVGEAEAHARTAPLPAWAARLPTALEPEQIAAVEVWRAAHQIPETDLRPTGPTQHRYAEALTQRHLDSAIQAAESAHTEWTDKAVRCAPAVASDPDLTILAQQLARLARDRRDVGQLLAEAARQGALPDEHPAAALGYRVTELASLAPRGQVWETVTPASRPRPAAEPLSHHPDRSPGISR